MNTLKFIQRLPKRLFIAICLVFLFGFGPKIFVDQVITQNPSPIQAAACKDELFDCSCNGSDYKCMHKHEGCDTSVETHNELFSCKSQQPLASIPPVQPTQPRTDQPSQPSAATSVNRGNPHNFSTGYYINLAGGGADLNGNIGNYNAEADCNPSAGVCNAKKGSTGEAYSGGNVQRYICTGKQLNCDNSHTNTVISGPEYGTSINLLQGSPSCGKTVQLDVFDGSNNLKGFMTWYSGDCPASHTPVNSCGSLSVGESTCRNGRQVFCKKDAPECNGDTCVVDTGGTCGVGTPAQTAAPTQAPTASPVPTMAPVATAVPTHAPTASPVATQLPTVSPFPTATPAEGGTATVQCPDGTTHTVKSGENVTISCQTPQPSSTPVVTTTTAATVKELPKTGLPIAGLALTGLIPFGIKLRKFGSKTIKDFTPSSLWTNRELMK